MKNFQPHTKLGITIKELKDLINTRFLSQNIKANDS